jgi:hypothetical protein
MMPPGDAQTVQVRVQVIDMEPFALDLVLPTYIPARDLTQRVARDAGLGAFWEDGTRRLFWLRARGRVVTDEEKLEVFSPVPGELLHLLPQPPIGSAVAERPPEYPEMHGYAGAGWINVVTTLIGLLVWSIAWGLLLMVNCTPFTGILPGLGLATISTSFARHIWGGAGDQIRIPATAVVVFGLFTLIAVIPPAIIAWVDPKLLAIAVLPALFLGLGAVLMTWLAWFGAVEPIKRETVQIARMQTQEASAALVCAICNQVIDADVKTDCMFKCGRVFHSGCYRARQGSNATGQCLICGFKAA